MDYYAGIDVSLEWSSVCVVNAKGDVMKEIKVKSDRDALVAFFQALGFAVTRIGLEAGPLSQWLYAGLTQAGCRFRFQSGTGGVREIKALREMSPAAFSVSIETGSTFFRFQLGLIYRLIDRPMNAW